MSSPDPAAQAGSATDDLPSWSLDDLYKSLEDPAIAADLDRLTRETQAFAQRYQGKTAALIESAASAEAGGAALLEAIAQYEAISDLSGRLGSYASLIFAANNSDPQRAKFYADTQSKLTELAASLLFFEHELNDIGDEALEAALNGSGLARYRSWLRQLRALKPYRLSQELERFSLERDQTASTAWTRLYDQTLSDLRVEVDGKPLTLVEAMDLFSDLDRARRQAAAEAVKAVCERNAPLFGLLFNTLVKDKAIEDRWRGLDHPTRSRHLSNDVDGEVVEALAAAVRESYPRLSHRYYAWKAKALGFDKLAYWDRLAPLEEKKEPEIPWDGARAMVLDAFGRFAPVMADTAARFFDHHWIDAVPRTGKSGGAFSHPTVPSAHPYVLLNYQGKARDVMTLAHELGHGVHQCMAAQHGPLLARTPLTLAETASVFGEMLTFRTLLDRETDPARRRLLLAAKVEDKIGTVMRQIAFYEFEKAVHGRARSGELTAEDFNAVWRETQEAALGPAVDVAGYDSYWCLVPHFIHVPFYVYAYAFGDGLVNALYDIYEQGDEGFVERYLDLLAAGGTRRYDEALKPFGLDPKDPAFWTRGLDLIGRLMSELEETDG